ncbi:YHS domain-containing protein, partial [Stutzerimonas nitrititolerans]
MAVKPDSSYHETYEGKTYRFCSARCQEKFQADPQRFASGRPHEQHQDVAQ